MTVMAIGVSTTKFGELWDVSPRTLARDAVSGALKDAGMEVIYMGLRRTPEAIIEAALQEDVDVLGISSLAGAHSAFISKLLKAAKEKKVKIALIVGDPELMQFIAPILEGEDYRVKSYVDQQEALHDMEEDSPDLIISEFQAPRINGLDFCKTLRKNFLSFDPFFLAAA